MTRWQKLGVCASALGLASGAWIDAAGVLAACLSAAVTLVALPLGCLFWRLLLPLIQGQWRADLAPRLAIGLGSLPWALLGLWVLLPAAFWLYPWGDHGTPGFRGAWLNPWSFSVRLIGYGLLWWWLGHRWSGQPHERENPALAALSLIVLVLSLSAAAIDWLLSLDADLASTIFGLFYVSRVALLGLAWLGLASPARSQPLVRGLLIGACLLWLYLHYMQYLAVWAGNLPREINWYLDRRAHGWAFWAWLLAFAQVVLPLGLLVLPWGRHPWALRWASGLTLAAALLEISWLGLPSLGLRPSAWLLLAWLSWASWAWPGNAALWLSRRGHHGSRKA